jgi:hypothetical protein
MVIDADQAVGWPHLLNFAQARGHQRIRCYFLMGFTVRDTENTNQSTMRTLLSLIALTAAVQLKAQCPFTPTIDPPDLLMCPLTTDTLTTQEYDNYQWYKDGQPIPGANAQSLVVDYYSSVTYDYSVEVSLGGCTAHSDSTHIDGWAFIAPSVFATGDAPYDVEPDGTPLYCSGDTVELTLGAPYRANITWFQDGAVIPGATSPTLTITNTGSYYAHAAPDVCPHLLTGLDLDVYMIFEPSVQPTLTTLFGGLCANVVAEVYEWSLNGTVIPGLNTGCIEPTVGGDYTVRALPAGECDRPSEPFTYIVTGVEAGNEVLPWTVHVDHAGEVLTVQWGGLPASGPTWRIVDVQGRTLRSGFLPMEGPLLIATAELPAGMHLFQALHQGKQLAPSARFAVLH